MRPWFQYIFRIPTPKVSFGETKLKGIVSGLPVAAALKASMITAGGNDPISIHGMAPARFVKTSAAPTPIPNSTAS